jgi:hypothetical protein
MYGLYLMRNYWNYFQLHDATFEIAEIIALICKYRAVVVGLKIQMGHK